MVQTATLARVLERDPRLLDRFWSAVELSELPDGCWQWLGPRRPRNYPAFFIGPRSVGAARVAWYIATGELPRGGRVRHECGNEECVRPSHLRWEIGRTTERRLLVERGGYLGTTGIPTSMARSA
jgi:hypothetical protein